MNVYLDTSGLNYLADSYNHQIMQELHSRKIEFFFSPITLWEILLNSDTQRREKLIYWGQMYSNKNIIKSPSEILINYIKLKCPVSDRRDFAKNPFTKLDIGKTWKNIHKKIDRTIPIDTEQLKEYTETIYLLSKKLKSIVNEMISDDYEKKDVDYLYLSAKKINNKSNFLWDHEHKKLSIISVILAFFILCTGVEMDKSLIRKFWNKLKIEDPFDRLDYLIKNHIDFFKRGPLVEMSFMAKVQIGMKNSKSRGLIHDCFHVLYAYYADLFITGDRHFQEFAKQIDHVAFNHIIMTDTLEQKLNEIKNSVPNGS